MVLPDGEAAARKAEQELKDLAAIRNEEVRTLMFEQRSEVTRRRDAWLAKLISARQACQTAEATEKAIRRHETLRDTLKTPDSTEATHRQRAIDRLKSRLATERAAANAPSTEIEELWKVYQEERQSYDSYAASAVKLPGKKQSSEETVAGTAFGWNMNSILKEPNVFLNPPMTEEEAKRGGAAGDLDATSLARRAASRASAFLFDRPVDRRVSGLSLEIGSADSRIALQIARSTLGKFSYWDEKGKLTLDEPYINNWTAGLSARADGADSIFKSGKKHGLLDDLAVNVGFSRTFFKSRAEKTVKTEIVESETEAMAACKKAKWQAAPHIAADKLAVECSGEALRAWALAGKKDGGYSNTESQEAVTNAVWGRGQPVMDIGINLELGRRKFTYRNLPVDPASDVPETRWPFKVSAHVGRFVTVGEGDDPQIYGAILTEIGREDEIVKASRDQTICPVPATGTTFVQCSAHNISPPVREYFRRVGVQGKVLFSGWPAIPRIGIAPKFTFDLKQEQFALDVPITFVESSDGKLSAGIRLKKEWEGNDPDPFSVGIFLGTAFDIAK